MTDHKDGDATPGSRLVQQKLLSGSVQEAKNARSGAADETAELTRILSQIGTLFRVVPKKTFDGLLPSTNKELNMRVNTYINVKVREGQRVGKPKTFVKGLEKYLNDWYDGEIATKKSPKGKATWEAKKADTMKFFKDNSTRDIENLFAMYNLIVDAKHMIVRKLEKVDGLKTLLKTILAPYFPIYFHRFTEL